MSDSGAGADLRSGSAGGGAVVAAAVILLAALQYGLAFHAERSLVFDDAFITYRYAANLADGHGITWNPGEPPVEGYTNFLLVILLAPFIKLGLDPLRVTRILSLLAAGVIGVLLYRTARRRGAGGRAFAALFAGSYFLLTPTARLSMVGLETVIYALFVLWAFLAAARAAADESGSWRLFGLLAFFAFLLRPEALLLPLAALLAAWATGGRPAAARMLRGFAPLFGLPLTGYLVWKYLHFGGVLPSAFFIKANPASLVSPQGLASIAAFAHDNRILLVLALSSVLVVGKRREDVAGRLTAVLFVLLYLLFFARVDTLMDIQGRFLYPTTVVLAYLALPTLAALFEKLSSWEAYPALKTTLSMVLAVLLLSSTPFVQTLRDARDLVTGHDRHARGDHLMQKEYRAARALSRYRDIEKVRIAIADSGVIPYYTGAPHLDPVGLNDAHIARERDLDRLVDYFFGREPVLVFWPADKSHSWITYGHGPMGDLTLYASRPEWDDFGYVGTIRTSGRTYDLHLFALRRHDRFEALREFLARHVVDGFYEPFPLAIGSYEPDPARTPVWKAAGLD
jgi:hypothetical protein